MQPLRHRVPPSSSLVTFEAAARTGSFAGAARALAVTPAAVTQQVRRLEEFVGVQLFQPQGRGRLLTRSGQQLFEAVGVGLEHIAGAIDRIREQEAPPTLTIATPLAFASLWLIPRIAGFRRAHPEVALRFISAETDLDPAREGLRLAVRFGDGEWPHLRVKPLLQPTVFPVCSPAYLQEHGRIGSVQDLVTHTLLDREPEIAGSFGIGWTQWLAHAAEAEACTRNRIYFNSYEIVIRSTLAGQGVALGVDVLVADLIRQGLLTCAVDTRIGWKEGYHLVSPKNEPVTRPMKLFSDWLLAQSSDQAAS